MYGNYAWALHPHTRNQFRCMHDFSDDAENTTPPQLVHGKPEILVWMKICFWTLFHSYIHSHWIPSYCCHTKINSHKKTNTILHTWRDNIELLVVIVVGHESSSRGGALRNSERSTYPLESPTIQQHPFQGFVCKFRKIASSMEKDYCPAFAAGFDCQG